MLFGSLLGILIFLFFVPNYTCAACAPLRGEDLARARRRPPPSSPYLPRWQELLAHLRAHGESDGPEWVLGQLRSHVPPERLAVLLTEVRRVAQQARG